MRSMIVVPHRRSCDGMPGARLCDLTPYHDASRQRQVHQILDGPSRPLKLLPNGQVGLPIRRSDSHILGGPAVEVEESSLDHLLGAKGYVRDRLLSLGVELDSAGTVAGGNRHGTDSAIPR